MTALTKPSTTDFRCANVLQTPSRTIRPLTEIFLTAGGGSSTSATSFRTGPQPDYPKAQQGPQFIQNFFDRRVDDLLNLYNATVSVSHQGEKGVFRESLVRGVLGSVLPPHFGLGTGIIVDKWGRQSRQTDIIVFDRRVIPPVVFQEGHGLYPFDAVHRTVEVKSKLKREHLLEAQEAALLLHPSNPLGLKIASQGTLQGAQSYYPFSSIFAFDADWDVATDSFPADMKHNSAACRAVVVTKQSFLALSGNKLAVGSPAHAVRLFAILLLEMIEDSAASRSKFNLGMWLS